MDENNSNLEQLIINGDAAFGSQNWSHEIEKQIIDVVDHVDNIYIVGCTTIVKIFLRDGHIHEAMVFRESRSDSYGTAYDQARNESLLRVMYDTFLFFVEFRTKLFELSEKTIERLAKQQKSKLE